MRVLFITLAALIVFAATAYAAPTNYAVVLTAPRVDPVYTADSDGNPVQTGTVTRPVGYVDNIIVLDVGANPAWTPGPGKKLQAAGTLKIGDIVP